MLEIFSRESESSIGKEGSRTVMFLIFRSLLFYYYMDHTEYNVLS